jgi:hypothetical protein
MIPTVRISTRKPTGTDVYQIPEGAYLVSGAANLVRPGPGNRHIRAELSGSRRQAVGGGGGDGGGELCTLQTDHLRRFWPARNSTA